MLSKLKNDSTEMEVDEDEEKPTTKQVYLPGKALEENEELEYDPSAYIMLHQAQAASPCLSFDIIPNKDDNFEYPLTSYIVAGTQSSKTHSNNVIVMKMLNLHQTGHDPDKEEDSDEEDTDKDEESKKPQMNCAFIKHVGCINRIRHTKLNSVNLVATWSETKNVNIFNINQQLEVIEDDSALHNYVKNEKAKTIKPIFSFSGHQQEGFAIDWCQTSSGVLATGDCRKDIHIWNPESNASSWKIDQRPLIGHTASVEDLQWSPTERHVLASCSVDKSIRIWDTRVNPSKACQLAATDAHERDVNVIHWNKKDPFIVSGGDDGVIHVWDLRIFQAKKPVATFKHHTQPVTSVEWHPKDTSVFASGGSDNQIALWDLAVEKDQDAETNENQEENKDEIENLPPQLLFIHQGQTDIKEIHWHPQLDGVILSTALSGFNIFKTISV